MTSFTTAMLTRTTEDPCIGTSAPYITKSGNTITLTPQNCEHSEVLVRMTPVSTMVPTEFIYTAPFNITEDTYISAYNLRAGYDLGDDASGKLFEYEVDYSTEPFFIQNESNGYCAIRAYRNTSSSSNLKVYYSYDKVNWSYGILLLYNDGSGTPIRTLNPGEKIYLCGDSGQWGGSSNYVSIRFDKQASVGGNLQSLNWGTSYNGQQEFYQSRAFRGLFYNNKYLVDISKLRLTATTLPEYAYAAMFSGCTRLTTIPDGFLDKATTMSSNCYASMFSGTAITTIPNGLLNSTSLASGCYSGMFGSCTSLVSAPLNLLPTTRLTSSAASCYSSMFGGCTSLTQAPELPADYVSNNAQYRYLFSGCSSLSYVKCMMMNWSPYNPADTNFINAGWLDGVAETGTLVKNPSYTGTWASQTGNKPSGWTLVDAS